MLDECHNEQMNRNKRKAKETGKLRKKSINQKYKTHTGDLADRNSCSKKIIINAKGGKYYGKI